jgi:hypothetical protein
LVLTATVTITPKLSGAFGPQASYNFGIMATVTVIAGIIGAGKGWE